MIRLTTIKPIFCDTIPKTLEHGKLYISKKYHVAVHLCACGCGSKTVTPLGKDEWTLIENIGHTVTLRPSIGNFEFPCKSHYFITENHIDWL